MATKRRYKRRTYRKKKRTQKRRVRGGGLLGTPGLTTSDPRISSNKEIIPKETFNSNITKSKYNANQSNIINADNCADEKEKVDACNKDKTAQSCKEVDDKYFECKMKN